MKYFETGHLGVNAVVAVVVIVVVVVVQAHLRFGPSMNDRNGTLTEILLNKKSCAMRLYKRKASRLDK